MTSTLHRKTFRKGSKTYFNSSRFFPEPIRSDVFSLYGFVRIADNYVDSIPQDAAGFQGFRKRYEQSLNGSPVGDPIIDRFCELSRRKSFDPAWTRAFFHSMELDLKKTIHHTLKESLHYIYGSAEVIGLFMAAILNLPDDSYDSARMLGRAMQYINFIRDIGEDNSLGRLYLPLSESSLDDLSLKEAKRNPKEFVSFIRKQLQRYREWQSKAEEGYSYLPRRYRIPIRTAGDMYNWSAHRIDRDPFVVFRRKVKPPSVLTILQGLVNSLRP